MYKSNEKVAIKVARNSIIINILLACFKLIAGLLSSSTAMISDGIHSIADLFSTVIAIIGLKLGGKKADKEHPYGHERFECVAGIILAILIFLTGIGIGWVGLSQIITSSYSEITTFGLLALSAALLSIIVKEAVYWYVRSAAIKIDSTALMADAWHSRLDGITSIGSFVGIFGALMGFPILDAFIAIIICLFILKIALNIFRDAISKMTDKACDELTESQIRKTILSHDAVLDINNLKTRQFGNRIYVDVEILLNKKLSLKKAHQISEEVHNEIENKYPKVKHCMINIAPYMDKEI